MLTYSSNWLILFPVAFSLFVALRLSVGRLDQAPSSWSTTIVRCTITIMMIFAVLSIGLRWSVISILWGILLAGCAVVLLVKRRKLERSALLLSATNACTMFQQQSLLSHFFHENVGWLRRTTRRMRGDLDKGMPWWRILEYRGVATGVYERLSVRLLAEYGDPPGKLPVKSSTMDLPVHISARLERLMGRFALLVWCTLLVPLTLAALAFIVPTLQELFEYGQWQLPLATQWMIQLTDGSSNTLLVAVLGFGGMALLGMLGLALMIWLFPRVLQIGPFDRFCGQHFRSAGFYTLATVMERGENNLVAACQATARLLPVPREAAKYQQLGDLLAGGTKPVDGLLKSRLLSRRELRAFGRGLDQQQPVWSLRQLAQWKIERTLNRYSLVVQICLVIVTVLVACIVGLFAIGTIEALAQMSLQSIES